MDSVKPSSSRRNLSEKVKKWLLGALVAGFQLEQNHAEGFYARMQARDSGQCAHFIHVTRGNDWFEVGIVGRQRPETSDQIADHVATYVCRGVSWSSAPSKTCCPEPFRSIHMERVATF